MTKVITEYNRGRFLFFGTLLSDFSTIIPFVAGATYFSVTYHPTIVSSIVDTIINHQLPVTATT